MRRILWVLVLSLPAAGDVYLGTPDARPSVFTSDGALQLDWGALRIDVDGVEAWQQRVEVEPTPTAIRSGRVGNVGVDVCAYRSPIWPRGADVLTVALHNGGEEPADVRVVLDVPDGLDVGTATGGMGGRCVLHLPADRQPERRSRAWGWIAGGVPMPGWARPARQCDSAFRNIRAGMGGIPAVVRMRFVCLKTVKTKVREPRQRPEL